MVILQEGVWKAGFQAQGILLEYFWRGVWVTESPNLKGICGLGTERVLLIFNKSSCHDLKHMHV